MVASEHATERRSYRRAIVHCPSAAGALVHLLLDPRWYVVRNAAELLGEMRLTEADTKLIVAVRHTDARVRRAAVASLGRLATIRAVHALQHAIETSRRPFGCKRSLDSRWRATRAPWKH